MDRTGTHSKVRWGVGGLHNTKVFETIRGASKRFQHSSNWNKLTIAEFLCFSFHLYGAKSQKAVPIQYLLTEYQELWSDKQ